MFILFGTAQSGGFATAEFTARASMLITISMPATPFLVRLGDRLTARTDRRSQRRGAGGASAAFQVGVRNLLARRGIYQPRCAVIAIAAASLTRWLRSRKELK